MARKSIIKIVGPSASQEAQLKARFGRKDWVVYKTRAGEQVAERLTAESLKRAMLEKGTQGTFTHILAGGHRFWMSWRLATNLLYQLKYPWWGAAEGPAVRPLPAASGELCSTTEPHFSLSNEEFC